MSALDLEAIRTRRANYVDARGRTPRFGLAEAVMSAEDVPALVAEVERLRGALSDVAEAYAPGRTLDTEVMYDDPTWDAIVRAGGSDDRRAR